MSDRMRRWGQVISDIRKPYKKIKCSVLLRTSEKREVVRETCQTIEMREKWRGCGNIAFLIAMAKDLTRNWKEERLVWGPRMVQEIIVRYLLMSGMSGSCLLTSQNIGSREVQMLAFIWLFLLSLFVFSLGPQAIGYCYPLSGTSCNPFWACSVQCVS